MKTRESMGSKSSSLLTRKLENRSLLPLPFPKKTRQLRKFLRYRGWEACQRSVQRPFTVRVRLYLFIFFFPWWRKLNIKSIQEKWNKFLENDCSTVPYWILLFVKSSYMNMCVSLLKFVRGRKKKRTSFFLENIIFQIVSSQNRLLVSHLILFSARNSKLSFFYARSAPWNSRMAT